jgi:hypothetical protein
LGQRFYTLDAIRRAAAIANSPVLRQAAVSALTLPDLRFDREIALPSDATMAVLDPAFERLALGRGTNGVELRSVSDGSVIVTLPGSVRQSAQLAGWSPDGRYVAITVSRLLGRRTSKSGTWRRRAECCLCHRRATAPAPFIPASRAWRVRT